MRLARTGPPVASPVVLGRVGRALAVAAVLVALTAGVAAARVRRAVDILPPGQSGFVSIALADGAAWFANYDRGTLTKVSG